MQTINTYFCTEWHQWLLGLCSLYHCWHTFCYRVTQNYVRVSRNSWIEISNRLTKTVESFFIFVLIPCMLSSHSIIFQPLHLYISAVVGKIIDWQLTLFRAFSFRLLINNNNSNSNNNNNNKSECQILAKEKYVKIHDRVCAQLHFNICKETEVQLDKKHRYEHVPKSVERSEGSKVTILWN